MKHIQRYRTRWRTGAVIRQDDKSVTITRTQRHVHVAAETVAVFAVVPFMGYLATRKELPDWARATSGAIALGTLIIDGGLLLAYTKGKRT